MGNFTKFETGNNWIEIRKEGNVSLYNDGNNLILDFAETNLTFRMILYNYTNFNISKWRKSADFDKVIFVMGANFAGRDGTHPAEFAYDADFTETLFDSDAVFSGVRFGDNAYFARTDFRKAAIFRGTNFLGCAQFTDVRFNGTASFRDAIFSKCATFMDITYNGTEDFNGAQFGM
jgi:hypothetical protein